MKTYIATFFTHFGALTLSKKCKAAGIKSQLMPVPRKLSSSCGTCVKFEAENFDVIFHSDVEEELENCYEMLGADQFKALINNK